MKKNSLLIRIIVVFTILVGLVVNLVMLYTKQYTEELIADKLEEESAIILQSLDWTLSNMLERNSSVEAQRIIDNISAYELIKTIHVYDANCSVLFSNNFDDENILLMNSSIKGIFEGNKLRIVKEATEENGLIMSVPIHGTKYDVERGSDILGAILIELNDEYKTHMISNIQMQLFSVYMLSAIGIVIMLSLILYVYIGKPLKRVSLAIKGIAKREYKEQYYFSKNTEFQELSTVFEDMSENIQKYNEELKLAKISAEEIGNARIEFLANMSHEIRTPLNSIIGFTDILEESEADSEKKNRLRIIKKAGDHLLLLINDILDVSKIELEQIDLEHELFSLKELLVDIYKFYAPTAQKREIKFLMKFDKDMPHFFIGDSHRLRQIISNLLNNALKFTKAGSIGLEVEYDQINNEVIFHIKDTGIGISEEKQKIIFEPFLQSDMSTTRRYGGTGLGLAICKRLVELMDGRIDLISKIHEGSEFIVHAKLEIAEHYAKDIDGDRMVISWLSYDTEISDIIASAIVKLPGKIGVINKCIESQDFEKLSAEIHALKGLTGNLHMEEIFLLSQKLNDLLIDEGKITETCLIYVSEIKEIIQKIPVKYFDVSGMNNKMAAERKGKYKILLAEDVEENRELIKLFLNKLDVELDVVENGLIALERIYSKSYDLLLLDMQMPVMDGVEVINQLKSDNLLNQIYVIALTANARKEDMEKYIAMGCDWFISKPINKIVLREKIEELMYHE